jgi:excisionase family DNA binding protein
MTTMEQAHSVEGISKQLLVSEKTVRREIETGNLRAHRIRRQLRVFESDLRDYLARQINLSPQRKGAHITANRTTRSSVLMEE